MQAAHPCTVSARYAALAASRLVEDLSSLVAVAGSGRAPEGVARLPRSWARAAMRAAQRAGTMLMELARTESAGRGRMGRSIR